MPTLNWIGKEKVINHHQDVPFKVLEQQYTFNATQESENKIIHGDNLEALKALLPEYEGKIKCIYIDPPYNTGNENWVYNDNVNHPKIKKWLGQVVGKESEDLTRHDKWLCMMYPRLKLLQRLLSNDGAIFISIDDTEISSLRILCDEIFGINNFLTQFIWKRRTSSALTINNISVDHEYILSYSKKSGLKFQGMKKTYKNYKNPDSDPNGPWMLDNLTVGMGKDLRPNQYYDLVDPETNISYKANPNRVWSYIPESMEERIKQKRIVFPKNGTGRPMLKRYLKDLKSDINPFSSLLTNDDLVVGLNSEGTKVIQHIFGDKKFDYPKPITLVEILLNQVTNENDVILDSFAGSGTTAHAVLNLNKQDGGKRKFILIEMEDYAEAITAERVKRVINGYGDKEGTGGSFNYYELGQALFIGDNSEYINESVGLEKIRQYIWYSETRTAYTLQDSKNKNPFYLGSKDETAYYFIYKKNELTSLDYDMLATIDSKAGQYVLYADNCLLPREFMLKNNIVFKKIPRDITRF